VDWPLRLGLHPEDKTYVHASHDDLRRGGAALARIHKIV
jgi:hypothetical protein